MQHVMEGASDSLCIGHLASNESTQTCANSFAGLTPGGRSRSGNGGQILVCTTTSKSFPSHSQFGPHSATLQITPSTTLTALTGCLVVTGMRMNSLTIYAGGSIVSNDSVAFAVPHCKLQCWILQWWITQSTAISTQ